MESNISAEFPFESKFVDVMGSSIHYIDEGTGDPILFVHGNPTSAYIWRNILPHVSQHARCIAVDLIGFGQSDKPNIHYGFTDTYAYLEQFIETLQLQNITLVVQDWGSGLGFHYAHTHPDNIKGIAFMEAMYKQVDWNTLPFNIKLSMTLIRSTWFSWLTLGLGNTFVRTLLPQWIERTLTQAEHDAYLRPFPTVSSRKPIYVFPRDVPVQGSPKHTAKVVDAYHQWLTETKIPKLCIHADPGMLISMEDAEWIRTHFPNTTMVQLGKGSHFIQEDHPHTIGRALATWYTTLKN